MKKIKFIFFIVLLFVSFNLSCNDDSINVDKVEHQYVITDDNQLYISLNYNPKSENKDTQFITLTSPDNNLKWESESFVVFENNTDSHIESALFSIPYSLEGDWNVDIKLGENIIKKQFNSATPNLSEIEYPSDLKYLKLRRVNGNSFSFVIDNSDYEKTDKIWEVYGLFKDDNSLHFLKKQRSLNNFAINISNKVTYVLFVCNFQDNINFYKIIKT